MGPHGRSLRVAPEALQAAARETLRLCRLSKAAQAALEPQAPAPPGPLRLRPGKAGSAALAWIENPMIAYFTPDRPEHGRLCDLSFQ